MPTISVVPFMKTIDVSPEESLFVALRRHRIPIASSCDGDGVCAKCRITVLAGGESMSTPTPVELALIGSDALSRDERLACQTYAAGDGTITTTYW